MTHTDYTRNILNIKDKNIYFFENCLESKKINNIDTQVFSGILTYIPDSCPYCGVINSSHNDIIKWGFKHNCKVKLPKVLTLMSYLLFLNNDFIVNTVIILLLLLLLWLISFITFQIILS